MKKVVIVGSSRAKGDTFKVSSQLIEKAQWDLINLSDYKFGYYDYTNKNKKDDYLDLMNEIILKYDTLIFATPVYWYAMSGIMKVFFDRITDLLTVEKGLGRKLRGKKMAVISSSTGDHLNENFWIPFVKTADYLGIKYLGNRHTIAGRNNELILEDFIRLVENNT